MTKLFSDTSPEAEAVLIRLLREKPAWQRLAMVGQLNGTARTLALSGLKSRHPGAGEAELRRRLADLLLGPELTETAYSPFPTEWDNQQEPATHEPIDVTLLVVEVLDTLGVRYAIGGSLAAAFHGIARSTLDADLVAELHPEHVASFVYQPTNAFHVAERSVREAIKHRQSFNLIHLDSAFKVDLFIPRDREFDRAQLSNATMQIVSTDPERSARVATAEDTILAKLEWYRLGGETSDQQWRDIMGIIAVQGGRLDSDYMELQAAGLGVEDLLHRAMTT